MEKGFRAAARRAGLHDVTPHTLRHTRVSELAQRGEKIPNISAHMAMSEQTIWGIYAHVNNEDLQDMATRIRRSQNVRRKPHNDQ
ncbi:tyrosine-type recombinase/integrase [Bartonella sp. HY038]|uniref:tyrosine-type recombinase/integrase n=1 Tax=Bartonella sp. HY038 TaxID=2759660 RepID=UPI00352C8B7D